MVTKLFGFAAGLLALSALTNAHGKPNSLVTIANRQKRFV
jgi:hypothetical protein